MDQKPYKLINTSLIMPNIIIAFCIIVLLIPIPLLASKILLDYLFYMFLLLLAVYICMVLMTKAESIRLYDEEIVFIKNYIIYKKVTTFPYALLSKVGVYDLFIEERKLLIFKTKDRKSYETTSCTIQPNQLLK